MAHEKAIGDRRSIIAAAAGLRSDEGENTEYDRALVELTCELLGLPIDKFRDLVQMAVLGR